MASKGHDGESQLRDEAENLHELVADGDDEDSTLLVSPAAKEALALVPRLHVTSQASTYRRAHVLPFVRGS
jgi:hypothetical protein